MASVHTDKRGKPYVSWRELAPPKRQHVRYCPTVAVARELCREIRRVHALGQEWWPAGDPRAATVAGAPPLILRDLLERYVEESGQLRARATAVARARRLDVFQRFADEVGVGVSGLSRELLVRFVGWLRARPTVKTESTIHKYVRGVEHWWRWAADADDRVPPPKRLELTPAPRSETRAPTWAQMDAAIAACLDETPSVGGGGHAPNVPLYRLMVVLRCTGLRVQQAMALEWSDVDLRNKTLTVRPELGKTPQERAGRTVPLAPPLVKALRAWRAEEDAGRWVVPSNRSGATPRLARQRDAVRAWQRSGVPAEVWRGQSFHAFRKGFVSGLGEAGVARETVDYLVGHTLAVHGRYAAAWSLRLAKAVALVPVIR